MTLRAELTDGYYGSEEMELDSVLKRYGDTVEEPDLPDLSEDGYVFRGWQDEHNLTWDFSRPVTENLTLTANFLKPPSSYADAASGTCTQSGNSVSWRRDAAGGLWIS